MGNLLIYSATEDNFYIWPAGAAALPAMPRIASAQTYPTRPIRLVVPFPPGGVFDAVARPWVDQIKPLLGTMIVENIGGGGSSLGAAAVARDRQCETFVSKASG
jgi:tripartite-type tricarboxylate transporter receptor subunit TctC